MIESRLREAAMRIFAERSAQITVSELAEAAGVARGTVYNHVHSMDSLFSEVATDLAVEIQERVVRSFGHIVDPAERFAVGIRLVVRRAHEDRGWGKFLYRFAMSEPALEMIQKGPARSELENGITIGRFTVSTDEIPSVLAMIGGAILAAILLVVEGFGTWRKTGSDIAEMVLRALGLPAEEAHRLAQVELPVLAPAESRP